MTTSYSTAALFVLATLVWLSAAQAGDRCGHCGCAACCQKVCRLVVEEKKVPVTCWGCECEEFCLPGPSCRGCKNCEGVCNFSKDEDSQEICSQPKKFVWYDWVPNPCASVYTKKKLMKKTVNKTLPSYKWVVEDLCEECEKKAVGAPIAAGVEVPPPPVAGAKLKYSHAAAQ